LKIIRRTFMHQHSAGHSAPGVKKSKPKIKAYPDCSVFRLVRLRNARYNALPEYQKYFEMLKDYCNK
jgi:hypothetical protein